MPFTIQSLFNDTVSSRVISLCPDIFIELKTEDSSLSYLPSIHLLIHISKRAPFIMPDEPKPNPKGEVREKTNGLGAIGTVTAVALFICLGASMVTSNLVLDSPTWLRGCPETPLAAVYGRSAPVGQGSKRMKEYIPSEIESYFFKHAAKLGIDNEKTPSSGCSVWKDATSPIASKLSSFRKELKLYQEIVDNFPGTVHDLRDHLTENNTICDTLEVHPEGLRGIFQSGSLSQTRNLLEPLLPPMRSPEFCFSSKELMNMDYLVHDFASYCRSLKPKSRFVLIDMGASLDFHGNGKMPAVFLTQIYQRFGFHWDHIYAYEVRKKDPSDVFVRVPEELLASYHWINVGVSADPKSKMNPWNTLLNNFNEDDFIVVKLDIDTPVLEMALSKQLEETPELLKLVDVLYFEHHVLLKELASSWGNSMSGSVLSSMDLFSRLRKSGIDTHFWV